MKKILAGIIFSVLLLLLPNVTLAENEKLQELKNNNIIPQEGVDVEVKKVKHYYRSLDGELIEYTAENKEYILNKKIEDLNEYNSYILSGKQKLTLEELGGTNVPEYKVIETQDEAIVKVSQPDDIGLFGTLPQPDPEIDGDLFLIQNVNYLGKSGDNYRYLYNTYAEWIQKPFVTQTDALATAWDVEAVPESNTFNSQHYMTSNPPGTGDPIENTINLSPDELNVYGNGVVFHLQDYASQNVFMNRKVRVNDSKYGHPASVITEYYHTTFDSPGSLGINIGPASISFESIHLGDVTHVEYSYEYGDTN